MFTIRGAKEEAFEIGKEMFFTQESLGGFKPVDMYMHMPYELL